MSRLFLAVIFSWGITSLANAQHTLYGYVIDQESKETLIGANLYIPEATTGSSTNEYGYFNISLPEGETMLETSYIGYQKDCRVIRHSGDCLITIELKPNKSLAEVTVESVRPETGITSSRMGAMMIPPQQIMRTPAILGEADVIKALHFLPGVQGGMAGQSNMNVRGGDSDQNLFLLDGMILYNVEHVMGFESAFMPDAVKHVNFYRGSFPARYGSRLSSVTDVRTKDGDMQQYHGTFSIGLLSSHLSAEGPIRRGRTSFIVSARRTYADWLINALKQPLGIDMDRISFYFGDVNAKLNHRFSDTDRLYLSLYWGRDVMGMRNSRKDEYQQFSSERTSEQDIHWGNTLYHLRWNHIFSPKLFANTMLGYNQFTLGCSAASANREYSDNQLIAHQEIGLGFRSGINDLSAAIDFDYSPTASHHVRFGVQYTLHDFRPEVQSGATVSSLSAKELLIESFDGDNARIYAHEVALYAEDDMNLTADWQVNVGLRAALFSTDSKAFPALEPRLSLCRKLPHAMRAKASYSLMHQYVHKLTSSLVASPSDLWVPVTEEMKPMSANQWSLGVYNNRPAGWEFGIEAYWKEMRHVIDYIDGVSFSGNTRGWESKIALGRGRSYGMEFSAAHTVGRTTGMFNYTLSRSVRWYPDGSINGGHHFPFRFDRRHLVHLLVQHQLTDRIDLNATWNFASGAMVSLAKQQSLYIEPTAGTDMGKMNTLLGDYYSSRSNYRLNPTHQLDLSVNFHKPTRHGERIWNISLMNVYCHLNQDLLYTSLKTEHKQIGCNPDGSPVIETTERSVLKQITVIPILPSFTYTYKF